MTGINVWNYHTTAKRADQRIQEIFDFEMEKGNMSEPASPEPAPPEIFDRPDDRDPEAPYTTRFFIVRLDESEKVTDVSTDFIASVDKEEAEEFAYNVLNKKSQQGYYKDYRFQAFTDDSENIVIFLNSAMELHSARNVLMISVLLDNALKYSDENGIIRLDVYKDHGKTKIEVYNTCVLEDTKDLSRLFERFYRPDDSRSGRTGGSGIGLSIAQAVAEAYGGKIKVRSKDGKSILFQVTI